MTVRLVTHKFSVADYVRMHKVGIFQEDDRVELIQGEIVEMAAIGNRHLAAVNTLNAIFVEKLARRTIVSVQNPVRLNEESLPQPDIALLSPRDDKYRDSGPEAADVFLLVEVADSSIDYDQNVKRALYAAAGIPEYWIVNLIQNRIDVLTKPEGKVYTEHHRFGRGETLAPAAFPDCSLAVTEIVG